MDKNAKRIYDKIYFTKNIEKRHVQQKAWRELHKEERKSLRMANRDKLRLGKRIRNVRRRKNLGYNMLNTYFVGSAGHHINDVDVVFVPENVHASLCAGPNKELHREWVMNWYGDLDNMVNNLSLERICGG